MSNENRVSRRDFVKGAAAFSMSSLLVKPSAVFAQGSEKFKIALVGCGGRGKGALENCIEAAKFLNVDVEIVAIADYFKLQVDEVSEKYGIDKESCHVGSEGYKKVMASDADIVLLATPPNFRPVHFEAAVKAGKHVFIEKPVAVDPPGARRIMATGKIAAEKKLAVAAGTQRRHQTAYLQTQYAIEKGAIGELKSGRVWWCVGQLWLRPREEWQSDAEYLIRNWINFTELSGDHILEQHVHQLDVANWFIGRVPVAATGFGGRARRKTGNQFDFFSVDFDYGEDVHIHSMSRQINGCYDRVSEQFVGTKGSTWGTGPGGRGFDMKLPEFKGHANPYVQTHIDMMRSIIEGKPINEAQSVADSTMAGIMGRISAYSGQIVRWRELVDESVGSQWYDLKLSPAAEDFENGSVVAPPDDEIPVPGRA